MLPIATAHVPVLNAEVIEWSNVSESMTLVDGTLGGAGHAKLLLQKLNASGRLIGLDRDPEAIERSRSILSIGVQAIGVQAIGVQDAPRIDLVCQSYRELPTVLEELSIPQIDLILLDLGLSSDQLACRDRGFSFRTGGPLDLRFNPTEGIPASELLAWIGEEKLANIIYEFGEERFSRRIAKAIVERRRSNPVTTAEQLHDLIHRVVPGRTHGRVDSATRTFQALRIAVNEELEHLQFALQELPKHLAPGGRFLAISFHSLEDRLVKNAFRDHPLLNRLTKKPIGPSDRECQENPRSRSAKLRVAERV
ncbi:MAG: 16S rRNA (cytosine(1402)-N(4))-methyltransferase RsmH [Pirellulaceae bacterium]|nr:16S rRNA (cytosine(1402)-N(4))-methyltransferase RsmH [Pirellulaceae bacterium]